MSDNPNTTVPSSNEVLKAIITVTEVAAKNTPTNKDWIDTLDPELAQRAVDALTRVSEAVAGITPRSSKEKE